MIPKIIWQTHKTSPPPKEFTPLINSWRIKNPGYTLRYMDDTQCDTFIEEHFDSGFVNMYRALPLGVMRADAWRVAVVYIHGGVYCDLDTACLKSIDTWASEADLILGVETHTADSLVNFCFAAIPRHPALLAVLEQLTENFNGGNFMDKEVATGTPVQNYGQHAFDYGIRKHLDNNPAVNSKTKIFTAKENAFTPTPTTSSLVCHQAVSVRRIGTSIPSWRTEQHKFMKNRSMPHIKFVTTFSANGYQVYGKTWVESFLATTGLYSNITAKIYIEGMDLSQFDFGDKIEIVDFNDAIPEHKDWVAMYRAAAVHDEWNKNLAVKFSFKSFVMMDALKDTSTGYVVWLDADCIFKSDDFDNFPQSLLGNAFVTCQLEEGSGHVESGIVIFDASHNDKQAYLDMFTSMYMEKAEFNSFGQFFDGFVIGRTLDSTKVACVNLNKGYGKQGVQSDPSCTFLNPAIGYRFFHNIGITGKKSYADWNAYKSDPVFQLIHGVNDVSKEERLAAKLIRIDTVLSNIMKGRSKSNFNKLTLV